MTIWVITRGAYNDYEIVGLFSSEEKAAAYLNEAALDKLRVENPDANPVADDGSWLHSEKWEYYEVSAMEVDSLNPLEWRVFPFYNDPTKTLIGTEQAEQHNQNCQTLVEWSRTMKAKVTSQPPAQPATSTPDPAVDRAAETQS